MLVSLLIGLMMVLQIFSGYFMAAFSNGNILYSKWIRFAHLLLLIWFLGEWGNSPLTNDPACAALAAKAVEKVLGCGALYHYP